MPNTPAPGPNSQDRPLPGRPTRLKEQSLITTPEGAPLTYEHAIYQTMQATGLAATRCAEIVGLPRDTVSMWLNNGRRHHEAQEKGAALLVHEHRLAVFFRETKSAHARWIAAQSEILTKIGEGGLITSEVTETVDPTKTGTDGKPVVTERRVKSSRTLPDARVVQWQLERLAKDEFSPRVEVTGADGGPVSFDSTGAAARELSDQVDAYVQGIEDTKARAAEQAAAASNGSEPADG